MCIWSMLFQTSGSYKEELRDKLNIFMAIHNTDIPVNQVEMTTIKRLKWSFKSNHQELLVQYFIVLFILSLMASDYLFVIFKLFLA
jgi:hypothetical protein